MNQFAVKISGLSSKITVPVLQSNFSLIGPVLKVDLYNDLSSLPCAELTFESEELARKAIEQFNGKQLLKDKVTVEMVKFKCDKEVIGELVYPVARQMYGEKAGKITGMVVDAVLRIRANGKSAAEMQDVLSSEKIVTELVGVNWRMLIFSLIWVFDVFFYYIGQRGFYETERQRIIIDQIL